LLKVQTESTQAVSRASKTQANSMADDTTPNPATLTIDFNHDMLAMQAAVTV
jgi:hypothetical protein